MINICIIENNIKDYSFFVNALGNYMLIPPDTKVLKELRAAISAKYETGKKPEVVAQATQKIKELLEGQKNDGYLVDYILKDGNSLCNGTRFIEDFIPNGWVLIVTTGGSASDKNKIMRFISENKSNYEYLNVIYKPEKLDEAFRELLLSEIRKISPNNDDPEFNANILQS